MGRLEAAIGHPGDYSPDLKVLTDFVASMPDSSNRERASALWAIVQEEIQKLDGEGQRPAVKAAFRLGMEAYRGPEYDSLGARLEQAKANGDFGSRVGADAPRRHWGKGVRQLALQLEVRLCELATHPEAWRACRAANDGLEPRVAIPEDAQPIFVERLVSTYAMKGRAVNYTITERLVTAREDGIGEYIVRAAAPVSGLHNVQVRALLNCTAGPARHVPDGHGGETQEVPMIFPARLSVGERCFFASQVIHEPGSNEHPIVEIQVTSHGIAAGGLTMRIQFEVNFYPAAAWWFGDCIDARRLVKPDEGHPRRLETSSLGYLEHTFTGFCSPMAKYGIGWEWGRGQDGQVGRQPNFEIKESPQ